jgi:hypothetical protein
MRPTLKGIYNNIRIPIFVPDEAIGDLGFKNSIQKINSYFYVGNNIGLVNLKDLVMTSSDIIENGNMLEESASVIISNYMPELFSEILNYNPDISKKIKGVQLPINHLFFHGSKKMAPMFMIYLEHLYQNKNIEILYNMAEMSEHGRMSLFHYDEEIFDDFILKYIETGAPIPFNILSKIKEWSNYKELLELNKKSFLALISGVDGYHQNHIKYIAMKLSKKTFEKTNNSSQKK